VLVIRRYQARQTLAQIAQLTATQAAERHQAGAAWMFVRSSSARIVSLYLDGLSEAKFDYIHRTECDRVNRRMVALADTAALFKLLSHPSRLAILALLRDGEQCVCHMEAALHLRQAYISQQLMVLRRAGLITDRRDGWNVFYRLTKPEVPAPLDAALATIEPDARATLPSKAASCPCPKCQIEIALEV
jgi:DNA-binding transcriptional ArsR family regulator